MLMAFDLLELDGDDQRKRPLRERRRALEHLLSGERLILPVRRLSSSGLQAWKEVLRAGYEGLVAKDPESPYVPGRTLKWLKVEQKDYREVARVLRPAAALISLWLGINMSVDSRSLVRREKVAEYGWDGASENIQSLFRDCVCHAVPDQIIVAFPDNNSMIGCRQVER